MNKVCKEYISDAKKFFPIMGKDERNFLRGLSGELEELCVEKNISSKHELFEQYGQPYEVANEYYKSVVDTEKIIKKIKISKYIKILVSILILTVVITTTIFVVDFVQTHHSYSQEEMVDSDAIVLEDDSTYYNNEHDIVKSDEFIEDDEIIE